MATQAHCGSCGAPIFWLKHVKTGKPAPIEARTDPNGNILTDVSHGTYSIALPAEKVAYPEHLHLNHFVTCPQAKTWARHGGRGTTRGPQKQNNVRDDQQQEQQQQTPERAARQRQYEIDRATYHLAEAWQTQTRADFTTILADLIQQHREFAWELLLFALRLATGDYQPMTLEDEPEELRLTPAGERALAAIRAQEQRAREGGETA